MRKSVPVHLAIRYTPKTPIRT